MKRMIVVLLFVAVVAPAQVSDLGQVFADSDLALRYAKTESIQKCAAENFKSAEDDIPRPYPVTREWVHHSWCQIAAIEIARMYAKGELSEVKR